MQETNQFFSNMEYQKSLNQNYLVFKNELGEDNYELRMLAENQINYLLPMELRSIDGREDIYYKIESFQPLIRLYKNREMKLEDVRIILIGLTGAIAAIQEYMLDERHVVLLPEYIFIRTESREVRLLFHPFYEGDIREGVREFANYLIGRIDHTEQQAVMMGYQFYRIVREDNFILEDIVNLYRGEGKNALEKNKKIIPQKDVGMDREIHEEEFAGMDGYFIKEVGAESEDIENNCAGSQSFVRKGANYEEKIKSVIKETGDKTVINLKKLFIFSVLALISGIFLCFGIGHYQPDQMAKVMLALVLFISVLGIGKEIMHQFRNRQNHNLDENRYDKIFSDHDDDKKVFNIDDEKKVFNIDDDKQEFNNNVNIFDQPNDTEKDLKKKSITEDDVLQEESAIYGRTVLLSVNGKMAENILMEKKRGKELAHQIEEFPYIIGKVKDSVNLVLNDVSVSRIHAKLTEEDGQVYVQDCNSTNGTYVNGVLLEKEDKIPIEADDEIRIGRVTLLYQ